MASDDVGQEGPREGKEVIKEEENSVAADTKNESSKAQASKTEQEMKFFHKSWYKSARPADKFQWFLDLEKEMGVKPPPKVTKERRQRVFEAYRKAFPRP